MPYLVAGSDLICSGMGSVLKYDNSFNPSLLNGEELEDYLVLQRDFEADGGLTPLPEERALDVRRHAIDAVSAVFEELGLAHPNQDMKTSVALASGSDDTRSFMPRDVSFISEAINERCVTVIDVIRALAKRGYRQEAENLLNVVKLRLSGDYLQTSSMIRNGRIVSAVNDPNDYLGPGSGYRVSEERRRELNGIRDVLDQREVLRSEAQHEKDETARIRYRAAGSADSSHDPADVVIGISPAFGLKLFQTTAGHRLSDVLWVMMEAIRTRGLKPRVVRFLHTADTSFLGLSAAQLAGSGVGVGIQAKGTAVIHQKGRLPHNNLELFSNAPITRLFHYQALGANAAAYALGEMPEPVVVPQRGEAMGSRFHARVAMIYAIETGLARHGAAPESVDVTFLGERS
jgi:propanediol dehydratase large subunit